jgi:hypothetical protein
LAAGDEQAEDFLDKLVLQVKAVSLLYGSEAELRGKLEKKLLEAHDESVRRFVKALQVGGGGRTGSLVVVALGELVLASLLVVAGTVVLIPTVVGINTLSGLVQYLSQHVSTTPGESFLTPYISFIEFVIGVVLVLSAFFTLREAAAHLKEAGLAVKTGET